MLVNSFLFSILAPLTRNEACSACKSVVGKKKLAMVAKY